MKTGSPTSKSTTFQTELIGKMTEFENKSTTFQMELIGKMTEFENKSTTSKGELIGKMTEFANKIPHYAREYKREYQFIRGLNKKFRYLNYFMENMEYDNLSFEDYKLDRIMKFIKIFLRAQEKGKFKDISNLEFDYYTINNISELKNDLYGFYSIIQIFYDWSKCANDKNLVCRYDDYKHHLELFFSKLNIKNEDSDELDLHLDEFCDLSNSNFSSDTDSDSDIYI